MRRGLLLTLFTCFLLVFSTACSNSSTTANKSSNKTDNETSKTEAKSKASGDLVIYTGRDQKVVDKVVQMFNEQYPDVHVNVLTMGAQQILERVRGEKTNPGADFWWGGTQSAFVTASKEGLLQPYKPRFDAAIKPQFKDPKNTWYGEMLLPEVIMYNTNMLNAKTAPQDWNDLLDSKWKDKILIRNVLPSGTMRTIFNSMIYHQDPNDTTKGFEWLKQLDKNTKEYVQDPTNLYLKLARQEGSVTLWDFQDVMIEKYANNQPFDYIYPKSGAPILVDAVGLVKGAKNEDNAKLFYEFLFNKKTVEALSKDFYQIPSRSDVDAKDMPKWYKDLKLKELKVDWNVLAQKDMEWMQYWDQNIKNKK